MNTSMARPARDDWDQHWSAYSAAAERNPAQTYRRQVVGRLLRKFGCGGTARILDIGSGQGDLASDLRSWFPEAEVAGVELSPAGVEIASRKVPGARFFQRDLLRPEQAPEPLAAWAQYAVCSEVLEHLDEPGTLLANVTRYLAPGATIVVTVPGGPKSEFDRHIGHRHHYTPAELGALLESEGFAVDLATSAGFPFFNLYRLVVILRGRQLIADVDARTTGWRSALSTSVMALFRPLFALNIMGTSLGWQIVAVARWNRPEAPQRD